MPPELWKAIVYTLTSKSSGNLRIDQDTVALNFATARQRQSESINDFPQRSENIVNTFSILQLDPPSKATQEMRFIQGLENSRFSSMKTHFANELNMNDGRDLYPVDLHSTAAQASKWMIAGNKGPQDVHTSFAALKKPEHKHVDKSSQKQSPVAEKSNEIPKKCTNCGIPGHTILECTRCRSTNTNAITAATTETVQ